MSEQNQSTSTPSAIGSPANAFRIALEAVRASGARKVLDCPSGEGPFTKMLLDAGLDAHACDIFPDQFKVPGVPCTFGDMNGTLPYEDESFDAITCLNGLQRVWARGQALREFRRVLRPGGTLVVSYPNQGDLRRRMLYLATGCPTWNVIGPPHVCDPWVDIPASTFRYAMTTANVASGLESVGIETTELRSTHAAKSSLALLPLALVPLAARLLAPARVRRTYHLHWSARMDALLGAFLVVVGRKVADWTPPHPGERRTNR